MKMLCYIFALLTFLGMLAQGTVSSLILVIFCVGLIALIRKIESGEFFSYKKKSLQASSTKTYGDYDDEDDEYIYIKRYNDTSEDERVDIPIVRDGCIVSMDDGRPL